MVGNLTFNSDKTVSVETDMEIILYDFASFGERFLARLIDVLIVTLPGFCFPIIVPWLYWSLQQSSESQSTIGQKALRIKTLSVDGTKISFGQATGRYFGNFLNLFTLLIGFFMFFFNDRNQCLHDLISDCIVVKEIKRTPKNV